MQSSLRAQAHGHALIRLLARIHGGGAPAPSQSPADRLGEWVDWRHAVALSAALDARPAAAASAQAGASLDEDEFRRVRDALTNAIEGDRAFASAAAPVSAEPADADAAAAETAFYRQRYLTLQQVMEGETGRLRGRLRSRLAALGAAMGRLAAVDAVMERAVGAQERVLLAPLPDLLAAHCERLRTAAQGANAAAGRAGGAASDSALPTWRGALHRDMKQLLLAELDIRMQPAQGLLAALRTVPSESHAR